MRAKYESSVGFWGAEGITKKMEVIASKRLECSAGLSRLAAECAMPETEMKQLETKVSKRFVNDQMHALGLKYKKVK